MAIKLYNSKTREKQVFEPLDTSNVRMYVCGPTVYDRAHLGNARPVLVFDVLYRLLRHTYGDTHVTYVRNFTDVDDKINASALARQQGGDPRPLEALIAERTEETIAWYHADMDALGALRPNHEPRATGFIGPMVTMIEKLIAGGHAYAANGHVLFRVRSYKNYGALSGRSVDDMIAGARVEVAPFKEDPMDFVLWKPSSAQEPGWNSPWGRGRPGWHIECSAMSYELLGDTFDIHGGGLDLQFPHHENELAQSACAHPEGGFAQVWMHNEMLQVEGKKMSKSLGNFLVLRDVGVTVRNREGELVTTEIDVVPDGYKITVSSRIAIRLYMLETHYRKPLNWTAVGFESAVRRLQRFRNLAWLSQGEVGVIDSRVISALSDDLNTPLALHLLDELCKEKNYADLAETMDFLGLYQFDFSEPNLISSDNLIERNREYRDARNTKIEQSAILLSPYCDKLTELRSQANTVNDFSKVDAFKAALTAAGVEVRISKAGVELIPTPTFDPSKLDALL